MTDTEGDASTVPWEEFASEAEHRLSVAGFENAAVEARWLAEEASGIEPAEWLLRRSDPATVRGVATFDRLLERRLRGEPIQYVLGHWAFRRLDLAIDQRVLIPRPETELLVDLVLGALGDTERVDPTVVDLGTGSGAIALAVVAEHRTCRVIGTDVSADALAVARANLAGLGRPATRVLLREGSWFDALDAQHRGDIDVVVSNPPYIGADERLPDAVRDWEPPGALIAGPRGVEYIEHLVLEARTWLRPSGTLMIEMASDQTQIASELATLAGYHRVRVEPDLTGRARFVVASLGPR